MAEYVHRHTELMLPELEHLIQANLFSMKEVGGCLSSDSPLLTQRKISSIHLSVCYLVFLCFWCEW